MASADLRTQLYDAFKHRAILYYLIYDELRAELGAEKAESLLKRAIYRRGVQVGEKFAQFGPGNLQGLREAFLKGIPDNGRMFQPELERCDDEGLDIKFHGCPLRDAWLEAGIPEEDVVTICRIAATIDNGTFEGAGFRFSADTWQPGSDGCCHLHIRPGGGD